MPKLDLPAPTTSKLLQFFVLDSSKTDGSGLAGLAYNTSGLVAYYYREGAASAVKIDSGGATALVTMTPGTWTSCGFVAIDGTNLPGVYQLGVPDAALIAGAGSVVIMLRGATNMAPVLIELQLGMEGVGEAAAASLLSNPSNKIATDSNGSVRRG